MLTVNNLPKTKITVGIPAFNEEANIEYILKDLIKQKQTAFEISEIIVMSDGSTDKTVEKIINLNLPFLTVVDDGNRRGLGERENQIFKISESEVLVLVQADVNLKDTRFLEKLITPILNSEADLTAAALEEIPGRTFIEKVLVSSMEMKKRIFENHNNGNNVFTCHGPVRGFSKKLYKKLKFKTSIGEDGFSYLFCISNGYKYRYVKSAKAVYKLPDNLNDHLKQSIRYEASKVIFFKDFGEQEVRKSYSLPKSGIIYSLLIEIIKNPVYISAYIIILMYSKIRYLFSSGTGDMWDISLSSKKLKGRMA